MKLIQLPERSPSKPVPISKLFKQLLEETKDNPLENNYNKAVILFLNDEDCGYDVGFVQTNMNHFDILILLDVMKHHFMKSLVGEDD